MTVEAFDAAAGLRRLLAEGGITEEGLQSLTGISPNALRAFLSASHSDTGLTTTPPAFSSDEGIRLSILAAQLIEGVTIPDDERLAGILDSLMFERHLTAENIATLAGLDADDVHAARSDPRSLPAEKKYAIAIRVSYLLNAFNRAAK
ncbi:hypothetical protein SAMN06295879_0024 [Agreia bicolorata]|uniref:Uncharacterized protein n=1 Tax=Agreia bicolorata TaxID=110935 RepID=A0A1T4WPX3_9MICO|nr:HTH domain-containing protein [Agreia bicolorata]SKA79299.1 hypothetical protein SAMN06295879_0024 [Agreia bicolorata]